MTAGRWILHADYAIVSDRLIPRPLGTKGLHSQRSGPASINRRSHPPTRKKPSWRRHPQHHRHQGRLPRHCQDVPGGKTTEMNDRLCQIAGCHGTGRLKLRQARTWAISISEHTRKELRLLGDPRSATAWHQQVFTHVTGPPTVVRVLASGMMLPHQADDRGRRGDRLLVAGSWTCDHHCGTCKLYCGRSTVLVILPPMAEILAPQRPRHASTHIALVGPGFGQRASAALPHSGERHSAAARCNKTHF